MDRGLTRHEIAEILDSEYIFPTAKGLEMARIERGKTEKCIDNTHDKSIREGCSGKVYCTIHNRLSLKCRKVKKAESPALLIKNSSRKSDENFDPKKFNKKF